MAGFRFDERARLSIELALASPDQAESGRRRLNAAASAAGLSGAEIDLARRGASFDYQISKAIDLALANEGDDSKLLRMAAVRAGIDEAALRRIEAFARDTKAVAR